MSARCPDCGRGMPGDVPHAQVCRCGTDFAGDALFHAAQLNRDQWATVQAFLMTRSGGRCETRTEWCTAPGGDLAALPRDRVSIHHRQPRGSGGTTRLGVHSLANLLLICGTGVTGCHGWIEHHRRLSERRGLLVPHPLDPSTVPAELAGGRRVLLHPASPFYLPPADGVLYAI